MMQAQPTPEQFTDATWADIAPLYDELAERNLNGTGAIEQWLDDWSALENAVREASYRAWVENSRDSENEAKEAAALRFMAEIDPKCGEQVVRLANRLIETGYTRPDLEEVLRRFRTDREIFREENIPLKEELARLANAYNKICGSMTADWEGEQLPLDMLNPFQESPDRAVREAAWTKYFQPFIDHRDEFADIFDRMLELRQQIARNAGFGNYRDYMFAELHRFDYTPEDAYAFHRGIEEAFVPLVSSLREERRTAMGLETLRPWDVNCDAYGRPPLRPFETTDELVATSQRILDRVSPDFGGRLGEMQGSELLDLDARFGKHPGGYCVYFPWSKQPFIFMNASGIQYDVSTLLHEAGHAVHSYESASLPFSFQHGAGEEISEVASMAMQLMTSGFLAEADGGFYSPDDAVRASRQQLVDETSGLGYIAAIDAFQHWLYTDPAATDRDARDEQWAQLMARFTPGVDYSGLEHFQRTRWYVTLHIFEVPFYFIEYGIAWLGALQLWRRFLEDPEEAVAAYRAALALGGSRPLTELYETAGIRMVFDTETMRELAAFTESQLDRLREVPPTS
jgi:oligoendopeptidase F